MPGRAVGGGVLVAVAEDCRPAPVRQRGNRGRGHGEAQVLVVRVVELPQHQLCRPGLGELSRVGDVQRKQTAPAGAFAAHQHRAPTPFRAGGFDDHVADDRRRVDVVAVLVFRVGQVMITRAGVDAVQVARHIGEDFPASVGIEAMQHAVVGADIHHRLASLIGTAERGVLSPTAKDGCLVVRPLEIGCADIDRGRVDDVAEHAFPFAEFKSLGTLVAAVPAQIGDARLGQLLWGTTAA